MECARVVGVGTVVIELRTGVVRGLGELLHALQQFEGVWKKCSSLRGSGKTFAVHGWRVQIFFTLSARLADSEKRNCSFELIYQQRETSMAVGASSSPIFIKDKTAGSGRAAATL
jgi:hypothetical protein